MAAMEADQSKYAIHAAAREGRVTVVESLLNADPKLARLKDDDGRLPIHWAASSNQPAIVLLLAQQKDFDPDIEANNNGQTVMHFVASKNNLEVARKLLENKSPASTRVRDKRGQYPLHRAAAVGSVPMINLLLKNRSPLNATDMSGYTALHHAIAEGHGDAAVALLKAGAEIDKRDSDGQLPLDLAPDKEVRRYIQREAEKEGIDLE
ncbi:putative ankyrin repeat domain-containing protein [Eutypa lata UCREL1]|uniref:Putative ankyrin repeat domain-containing protein n=1 Tax=Eutypa lata (strain UCR-EL1) TaxID=1287681 RepID=M7SY42_EUTLA|nr:putative ankyrin repeat domain-containing protein [Eutypa lata UCREL1]